MNIRMIALDLDGTTLNQSGQMTAHTVQAIQTACAQGVVVLPATGRPLRGLHASFLEIPGVRYAITSNGGAVWDLQTKQPIFTHPMCRQDTLLAIKIGASFGAFTDVYANGTAYTLAHEFEQLLDTAPPELVKYFKVSREKIDAFAPWLETQPHPIEKITMLFANAEARLQAMDALNATGLFEVTSSIAKNIELNAKQVDKGRALLELAQYLKFPTECVMACGDSGNDLRMLQAAGFSVAMGNASPQIKNIADVITASHEADGVALAIEQYVLL